MNNLKCPICGKQMKIGMLDPDDSMATVWMSIMPCDCVCSYGASKAVWQELIRTHKALDVAVDALKYANKCIKGGCVNWETEIDKALEQITALKQKDVK